MKLQMGHKKLSKGQLITFNMNVNYTTFSFNRY